MAATFAHFDFVRVVFIAALAAIVLQCLVYPARHLFGLKVARIVLRTSLLGFVALCAIEVLSANRTGDLDAVIVATGWGQIVDFGVFVLLTMFIAYFMGSRYLADEAERERQTNVGPAQTAESRPSAPAAGARAAEPRLAETDGGPGHA